jgi:ATP-dependent protease HslVU (ClpYQ) peptidase subunit
VTTIIGIQEDNGCLIAADSRTTADGGRPFTHSAVTKITKRGKFLVAGAGSVMPCDTIQHLWKPPAVPNRKDLFGFIVQEVVPSMRQCLKEAGYVQDKEDQDDGFQFLVAIHGVIYQIDDSYAAYMRDDGIYGIGSGSAYAIGALQAGATWRQAMQTAVKNDIYTQQPFIVQKQEKP